MPYRLLNPGMAWLGRLGGVRARLEALPDAPGDLVEMVEEVETTVRAIQREATHLVNDLPSLA